MFGHHQPIENEDTPMTEDDWHNLLAYADTHWPFID